MKRCFSDFSKKDVGFKRNRAVYESSKYETGITGLCATLEEFGVAVLPGVLDGKEIADMNSGMWNTMETISSDFRVPIKRKDRRTWSSMSELFPLHRFLIQLWGVGHAKYVWDVRSNANVKRAFAAIHSVREEALITSFDGVGVYLPTNKRSQYEKLWLHTDERFDYSSQPQRRSVQSWVTGFDVPVGSATLAFLEGSHKHHAAFGARFAASNKDNWYKLESEEEYTFLAEERGCALKAIACRAGSMVLFDSRLFHCGMGPPNGVQEEPRNVVYVCQVPRQWCTVKDIAKRRAVFFARRMTTHTPHKVKMFAATPRTYGAIVQPMRAPPMYEEDEMTPAMKQLVPLE